MSALQLEEAEPHVAGAWNSGSDEVKSPEENMAPLWYMAVALGVLCALTVIVWFLISRPIISEYVQKRQAKTRSKLQ